MPRCDIVNDLVAASDAEGRRAILDDRLDDILVDCDEALESITTEWARQCRAAIAALRSDLDGPAQSHASNIIDSVARAISRPHGPDHAKKRAKEVFDDLPLQLAAENLTLRPLVQAFVSWWPKPGLRPPAHFSRHATSHAVGHDGVVERRHALIAVMLATSLTVQFSSELLGEPELDPGDA